MSAIGFGCRCGRIAAVAALALGLACKREERRFNATYPSAPAYAAVTLDTLQPGVPSPELTVRSPSEGNAYDIAQGKQLFEQWNCSGCHSHGGGGMGPPLMDNEWIYGSSPENIVATIVEGRPNGMPSFRNRITASQLWQLAAYVRSMSGLEAKASSPGRNDEMQYKVDEQRTPIRTPRAARLIVAKRSGQVRAAMTWAGSIFDTAGTPAERIARLTWFLIIVSAVTYLLVLVAAGVAMRRARARRARGELADTGPETGKRLTRNVTIATIATTLILLVYVTATAFTEKAIAWPLDAQQPLTIEVTGHQWWWQFRYRDTLPSNWLTSSNELHIPVGRPVRVILLSNDVIHSFWIPELHGKQDVIPGHRNTTWIQADRPGVWKARCAEFCGFQHAKMAFDVVAESPAQFDQWYVSQLASARPPTDSSAKRGQDVFLQRTCIMCHTIAGTPAGSSVGPELTHIASRPSIAAGTLPNTRANLARWILNPQLIKPGVRMPPNALSPADMNALLDYLETLK